MRLTRKQREALKLGGAPKLLFTIEEDCPLEPGDHLPVCAGMELVIERVKPTEKGDYWWAQYKIRDFRVRLPRRNPPVDAKSKAHLDSKGYPRAFTAPEIEVARIAGGVTSAKSLAVPGHDLAESVEDEDHTLLRLAARARQATRKEEEREERARDRSQQAAKMIADTAIMIARKGGDPVEFLASIQRLASQKQDEYRDAA